jgi:hypothetical protein
MQQKNISNIFLYRMTHIQNIPHILTYGITHKSSKKSNKDYVGIGDTSLIDYRSTKHIKIEDVTLTLGNLTPFYFGIKMPMLYVIQHGGNSTPKNLRTGDIVYIVVSLKKIIEDNTLNYYFSDGHATDGLTNFFSKKDINKLPDIIDWKAIVAPYWGGGENLEIKTRKQAEFLVSGDISRDYIFCYLCHDDDAKRVIMSFGVPEEKIRIYPKAYY